MTKKIDSVLDEVLLKIKPSKETHEYMQSELNDFLKKIKKRISKLDLDVEPFVGGSFAKKTLIKKENYDVDLFLRFDKKYPEKDFRKLTKRILKKIKNTSVVHGSRDYFQIKIQPWFKIEVVPVRKINSPKQAENITDLSYSHVRYINKKTKQKVLDQILLAKAFAHATKTYGAESYVKGFSGYSLELLINHYGSFEKMLRELTKKQKDKIIIDPEKKYKNKKEILFEMNGSKLLSPIVLIDPTFKERNALAALSEETFDLFKQKAKEFLKKPSINSFSPEKLNLDELRERSLNKGKEFVFIKIKTKKPEGDVAGTKLLKFFTHLEKEISKYFIVKDKGFKYLKNKEGKGYFVLDKKSEIIKSGPLTTDTNHAKNFRKENKNIFEKNSRLFSKQKINFNAKEFLTNWKKKNKRKIKEMYITNIQII